MVAAAVYVTASILFASAQSMGILFLAAFMIGFHDQCTMMNAIKSIKTYSQEPYATRYVSWAMTGYATGPFLWPFLLSWIINPHNLKKTHIYSENGADIAYFSTEIVDNYLRFMTIQLVAYIVVIGTLIYCFESPPGLNGVFWKYIKHTAKGEIGSAQDTFRQSMRLVKKNYNEVVTHTIQHSGILHLNPHPKGSLSKKMSIREDNALKTKINTRKTGNKAFKNSLVLQNQSPSIRLQEAGSNALVATETEMLARAGSSQPSDPKMEALMEAVEKEESMDDDEFEEQVIREEIRRDMMSANFWIIVLMGIVRTSTSRYYLSYFKLLGLYYFDDDATINLIGSLSYLFYIVQGFTYPRVLDALGIKGCYVATFVGFAAIHVMYCLDPNSLFRYVVLTFVHRVS